jgi:hypothetical protein
MRKKMFNQDMLHKLEGLKQEAEESKLRLEAMEISEEAGGGLVRITLNGNRKVKSLEINADLKSLDKSDLEDLIVVALERALDRANAVNESEVMSSARALFPGF